MPVSALTLPSVVPVSHIFRTWLGRICLLLGGSVTVMYRVAQKGSEPVQLLHRQSNIFSIFSVRFSRLPRFSKLAKLSFNHPWVILTADVFQYFYKTTQTRMSWSTEKWRS